MAVIAIPKVIRDILGEEGSSALVEIFDKVSEDKKLNILEFVEEKFERRLSEENVQINNRITEEVAKLDKRITEEVAKLDKRITEEVAKLRVEFTEKISQTKVELIRWMFIFWIGQFASIVGTLTAILFAFFK